jgi:hypothetical protein
MEGIEDVFIKLESKYQFFRAINSKKELKSQKKGQIFLRLMIKLLIYFFLIREIFSTYYREKMGRIGWVIG